MKKAQPKPSATLARFVSTLTRRIQKVRREQLANEKRQAKSGMYQCAIESRARAEILQSVLNGIKSIQHANAKMSSGNKH